MVKCAPRRRAAVAAAAALIGIVLGGTARARVVVVDDGGNRIQLESPARRIVALSPHVTELVFDAGAGQWIVGAAAHSDYPGAARAIPRVGDARGLDLEAILRARPDLVVAWTSGNSRRTIDRLRRLGLQVFESEPVRFDQIASAVIRLGQLAGTEDAARRGAEAFNERLADLVASYAARPRVSVFYQIWDRPLLTVNGQHIITQALEVCGARNIFGHLPRLTAAPSREAVLLADPDAVVVASNATDALAPWSIWRQSRAGGKRRVFAVDPQILHRPTLRILDGVVELCARLHRESTP